MNSSWLRYSTIVCLDKCSCVAMLLSCEYVDKTIHLSCSYFLCSFTAGMCVVSLVTRP